MGDPLQFLLEQGSYGLMLVVLLAAGLGLPLPEDIVLIAGGILIHRGVTNVYATVAVCVVGVLAGDLMIFMAARRLGPKIYERRFIGRMLPPERRHKIEKLFARYGGLVVFSARHMAGLRAPTFAIAGIHGMSPLRFLLWDALALAISLPLWMYLGYYFAERIDEALAGVDHAKTYVLIGAAVLVVLFAIFHFVKAMRKSRTPQVDSAENAPKD